ncbi:unnamed protein product [Rotaria magnacalcarata]|uniref:Leucine-rich repeat and IQ domain-containing protein 3 n=12 Tax=Rotaria magnacalcarata TaxID=392030 RepID=A0A816WK32_9BILA|nr:unnamed protein product [Rotaria magnacalcarata]CAF2120488.1 unnamed protein product [Rotaria magnacalcarata]CAF2134851.1 unnamed protein product [Rotaria magnacalcarata]
MNIQRDPSPPPAESVLASARQNPATIKIDEQFLQEPTLAFLESHQNHLRPALASGIFVLSLTKLQLNSIGDIGQFKHIQICDLSSNFIEVIDNLLIHCRHLIKLDLHSNRINRLPDGKLWKHMSKLKILYLHDNLLSSYDDVKSLANTPVLEILTLYDSPLSIKKNYRHHVVNSVWSLKALDTYIIADDEIIEKTHFPEPYAAYSNIFKFNLYIPTGKNSTLNVERKTIEQVFKQINNIQSHYCPVLILQKNFRMWLVQLRLKKFLLLSQKPAPKFLHARPTFTPLSGSSGKFSAFPKPPRTSAIINVFHQIEPLKTPDSYQDKRHIKVHLGQLTTTQTDTNRLPFPNDVHVRSRQTVTKTSTSKYSDDRTSPILRGQKSQLTVYEPIEEINDEIRAARQYVQDLKDESHLKQRKREAEIKENNTMNRNTVRHHTVDDRLLRTIHGSMAFGCLVAVDKAYNDRAKVERRKLLAREVEQNRQEHSLVQAQLQHTHDERLVNIHRTKDQDRMKQTYMRHRVDHAQNELYETVQEQRLLLLEQQRRRREQVAFSQQFNSQHISISNALQRHENNIRTQRKIRRARETVTKQKKNTEEQTELIEKYLTQRKHVRRALSNIERKQLDVQAMRDASERLLQAQQRVAHIRARNSNIQQFSLVKMSPQNDELRRKTQSLTESMLERESLFDSITDHMAAQQTVQ